MRTRSNKKSARKNSSSNFQGKRVGWKSFLCLEASLFMNGVSLKNYRVCLCNNAIVGGFSISWVTLKFKISHRYFELWIQLCVDFLRLFASGFFYREFSCSVCFYHPLQGGRFFRFNTNVSSSLKKQQVNASKPWTRNRFESAWLPDDFLYSKNRSRWLCL